MILRKNKKAQNTSLPLVEELVKTYLPWIIVAGLLLAGLIIAWKKIKPV